MPPPGTVSDAPRQRQRISLGDDDRPDSARASSPRRSCGAARPDESTGARQRTCRPLAVGHLLEERFQCWLNDEPRAAVRYSSTRRVAEQHHVVVRRRDEGPRLPYALQDLDLGGLEPEDQLPPECVSDHVDVLFLDTIRARAYAASSPAERAREMRSRSTPPERSASFRHTGSGSNSGRRSPSRRHRPGRRALARPCPDIDRVLRIA